MTENELQRLYQRLRKLHRAERRRAWRQSRGEILTLALLFLTLAWLLWRDYTALSVFFGAFGLVLALAAAS